MSRRVHGAGLDCRWQGRFFALIVADRHFLDGFDCRVFWGPSSPCLSLEGGPATIALDIHLEDGGVMNETVDGRERHGGIREDPVPFAEGLVVCLGKTGPILERAHCGERIGESYGTSTFYAGTDHREAA